MPSPDQSRPLAPGHFHDLCDCRMASAGHALDCAAVIAQAQPAPPAGGVFYGPGLNTTGMGAAHSEPAPPSVPIVIDDKLVGWLPAPPSMDPGAAPQPTKDSAMPLTTDQRDLVTLKCSQCEFAGVPTLVRTPPDSSHTPGQLGAYCGRCKRFITWVKQTSLWLALEQEQTAPTFAAPAPTPSEGPAPGAPPTPVQGACDLPHVTDLTLNAQITGADGPHNPYTPGSGNAFAWSQGWRAAGPLTQDEVFINAITLMGHACYDQAEANGFHDQGERSVLELCMLVVTELAELAEAARNGTLDHSSTHIEAFTQAQEEWADILVRVFDHSLDMHIDPKRLGQAFVAKLAYNRTRGYRHGGKTI